MGVGTGQILTLLTLLTPIRPVARFYLQPTKEKGQWGKVTRGAAKYLGAGYLILPLWQEKGVCFQKFVA